MEPSDLISKYFMFREAIKFPKWNRLATEQDGLTEEVIANLKITFSKLDQIRELFGFPIVIHVAFRSKEYNELINGAANSCHMSGMAVDFHIEGIACGDAIRKILDMGILEKLGLRCENNGPTPDWIHLDTRAPGPGGRYFKP